MMSRVTLLSALLPGDYVRVKFPNFFLWEEAGEMGVTRSMCQLDVGELALVVAGFVNIHVLVVVRGMLGYVQYDGCEKMS